MDTPVTILLEDRRAEMLERIDLVGNVGAAVSLLAAAAEGLPAPDDAGTALAVAELIFGGLLLVSVVRELRASRRRPAGAALPTEGSIGWVNVFAAMMLFAETYQRVYLGGKFSWATFLMGVVTLGLGIFHPLIERRKRERRFVRAEESGVVYRSSRLRGFRLPWGELASVEADPSTAVLVTRAGRRYRINLRRYRNGAEVVRLLRECAAERGIPLSGGAGTPAVASTSAPA